MVDRIKPTYEGETRRPIPTETLSSRPVNAEPVRVDELIAALAGARENRRARQVSEWEQMYHARRVST